MSMTETRNREQQIRPLVQRIELAWVSAADGSVNATTTTAVCGELCRVEFVPDSGGTQPTDLYDLTLLTESGIDILSGKGANLSNATKTSIAPGVALDDGTTVSVRSPVIADKLNLVIAAAGSAKGGKVILYLV